MNEFIKLELSDFFKEQVDNERNVARVIAVYKGKYKIATVDKVIVTEVLGNFLNKAVFASDFPAVGDWVLINDLGYIVDVLKRKSKLSRKTSGRKNEEQLIAANVDLMFIVTSLNKEFNINKLDRYIALATTCEIEPVIVLTKLDVCEDAQFYEQQIKERYSDIKIIFTSSYENIGIREVLEILVLGQTAVFVGASGVGKSTLVNKILGEEVMKTSMIREIDDKGRHTTTHRELFILENGACIIDTPGIREIRIWANQMENIGFEDIYEFAKKCKFGNCEHINEPECAVKQAVEDGVITEERYRSYIKMSRELYYAKLSQNEGERISFKNKVKKQCKQERYN